MQITADLDSQHLEKLHTLEKSLKKIRLSLSPLLLMKLTRQNTSHPKVKGF